MLGEALIQCFPPFFLSEIRGRALAFPLFFADGESAKGKALSPSFFFLPGKSTESLSAIFRMREILCAKKGGSRGSRKSITLRKKKKAAGKWQKTTPTPLSHSFLLVGKVRGRRQAHNPTLAKIMRLAYDRSHSHNRPQTAACNAVYSISRRALLITRLGEQLPRPRQVSMPTFTHHFVAFQLFLRFNDGRQVNSPSLEHAPKKLNILLVTLFFAYLLGLLAKIKCSICSYQLNLWYGGHWPPSRLNSFLDRVEDNPIYRTLAQVTSAWHTTAESCWCFGTSFQLKQKNKENVQNRIF